MQQLITAIDGWTLIKVVGGLAVVISAVVGFLAGTLRDYLGHRWRGNQERELESLKHQFSRAEVLLNSLATSGSSAYLATSERRLDHFQKLWNGMMSIKNGYPTLASIAYSVLTRAEIENLPTTSRPSIRAEIALFDPGKYIDFQFGIVKDAEASRPFVGQHAWNAFFSYQALHGRLVFLLQDGLAKGKVAYWILDRQFLDQVLAISISRETMTELLKNEAMAFNNVRNFLELAVLADVEAQTSGTAAIKEAVKQAQQLSEAMSSSHVGKGGT